MEVEALPSSSSYTDDDQNNLKQLIEAFGSVASHGDIASACSEAGRNLYSTAEKLCNMQDSICGTSSPKSQEDLESTSGASSRSLSNSNPENAPIAKLKSKKCPATMGTVSDVIGADYIRSRPKLSGLNEKLKPMKVNLDDFPVSLIQDGEKEFTSISQIESMDNNLGEFLFKMLGNGFQLQMSVIQEVIGQCGYNLPQSIDKLFDISAATLGKSDDITGITAGNTMSNTLDVESTSSRKQSPLLDHSGRSNSDAKSRDDSLLPQAEMKKKDIQREILESLFSVPSKTEEMESMAPVRRHRPSPYGQAKPIQKPIIQDFTFITTQPVNDRNSEENQDKNSYEELRKAVMENWITMKEYYKASLDAFIKKDKESAQNLLEEGNFFLRKAREADEKSTQKLIEESNEEEDLPMNMYYLEPKDALHHMKIQLTITAGLPSVRYLKVVVGMNGRNKKEAKKDARRKLLITKLLEKEGIPWTEEGNGWTISIRVYDVDPTKLSFKMDDEQSSVF